MNKETLVELRELLDELGLEQHKRSRLAQSAQERDKHINMADRCFVMAHKLEREINEHGPILRGH